MSTRRRGRCRACGRPDIALTDAGRIWRHDPPPAMRPSPLISCIGTRLAPAEPSETDPPALFDIPIED